MRHIITAFLLPITAFALDGTIRQERKEEAKSLRTLILRIDQYLPNLTPEQKTYVASEQEAISKIDSLEIKNKRNLVLYGTKEFQLFKIKDTLSQGMWALDYVLRDDLSVDQELYGWVAFVALFMDDVTLSDGIMVLEREKVLTEAEIRKSFLTRGSLGYGKQLSWRANAIMSDIVIPLSRKNIKPPLEPKR